MSAINKDLYDALIKANVSDELAIKTARSVTEETDNINQIKQDIAVIQVRIAMVEKLQWVVVAGIIALVIQSFIVN
ncbi:MAG TPA: hypothetical protein DD716_06925 [Thiomicrospira sp.]|nr:hypothetical protein [Thiomicrospira sp.]